MTLSATAAPFDDVRRLIAMMPALTRRRLRRCASASASSPKPAGSLGRLEWLVEWLAAWQGKALPGVDRPLVCVFAGSHGVTRRGVSAFPDTVNRQMLDNFAAGGAAINQICATYGLGFKVFDLALDLPTGDITEGPGMDPKGCVATMAFGMEAIAGGADLLGIGEMGIGNTTIAAAIFAALYGGPPAAWVGRGTGVDDEGLGRKVAAVEAALEFHRDHIADPLDILARLGGRDVAAMAGAILAARLQRIPVVIDGYVATAAAAVLHALDPGALDHCVAVICPRRARTRPFSIASARSRFSRSGCGWGEGSGAGLAIGVIKAAAACHREMATFAQAGVSNGV
jgi:nicotinate-nucleotide--dimethylbenzimidazole phosphoribosyltransferase